MFVYIEWVKATLPHVAHTSRLLSPYFFTLHLSIFSHILPSSATNSLLTYNSSFLMATETWEAIVSKKRAENAAMIPSAWRISEELMISETSGANVLDVPRQSGILTERQLGITDKYDATDLLGKIERKELSAYEVTEAFCIRAAIAQQVVRFRL